MTSHTTPPYAYWRWDACDPVTQALLNLVAAQNTIAAAIDAGADGYDDSDLEPALAARRQAADDLMKALEVPARVPMSSRVVEAKTRGSRFRPVGRANAR